MNYHCVRENNTTGFELAAGLDREIALVLILAGLFFLDFCKKNIKAVSIQKFSV